MPRAWSRILDKANDPSRGGAPFAREGWSTDASPEGRKHSILVVDDDEGIRENIADLLGTEDYRVVVASDANEAMERLAAEDVDLLLTDFQMPGRNGVELIEAARTTKKHLPAILMTAYLYVYEQLDEERRKAIALLRKPFDADEILRLVAEGLQKNNGGKL
jgi:DNA-binding NtrC family response regulator